MLKQLLTHQKLSQPQINELVELCYKIAYKYARLASCKIIHIPHSQNHLLHDLTIDSIASLFQQNENGELVVLYKSIDSWKPEVKTEEALLFCLNRIIGKLVQQRIFSTLKENDPFFAKILDMLNYRIRIEKLRKQVFVGGVFIVKKNNSKLTGNLISHEDFNNLPLSLFRDFHLNLSKILNAIASQNYHPAIPLNLLIKKLKSLNTFNFPSQSNDISALLDLNEMVDNALSLAKSKLYSSYFMKNKLDLNEYNLLLDALSAASNDLKNGGLNLGLHSYVMNREPNITKPIYIIRYRSLFEYLIKVMKNNIHTQISQ